MNAWLQQQQRRFMRADVRRYLQPDIARYLAPERKWDGQPRLPEGEDGGGRYTFGRQQVEIVWRGGGDSGEGAGGASSGGGPLRVEIDAPMWYDGDLSASGGASTGFGDFFLAALASAGLGHNGGPPLEDPPEIPEAKPSSSSVRTAIARIAASWISAALGTGASLAAAAFIGVLNNIEWLRGYNAAIESYRDPPRSLEELQAGVGQGRPGYEDHHIIERTAGKRWGLTPSEIDDKSNVVSIPRLKHYQITGWFQKGNKDFGGLSPRQYLSDKGVTERRAVGLRALEIYEVLKR